MLHLIKEYYRNPEEKNINFPIMNREYEKDLMEYIIDVFRSINSVLPEIEITRSEFVIDVDKVNQTDYDRTRSERIKDKTQKYVYIRESRLGELIMDFHVDASFEGDHFPLEYTIKMLIPIPDDKGYYLIKGKRYLLQYQLTESSTYTTSTALVTKSLMPVRMRKVKGTVDIEGVGARDVNYYQVMIFNKYENYILFFFATMGWQNALEYLGVGKYITPLSNLNDRKPGYLYIKLSGDLYLEVKEKHMYNEYISCIVGNIVAALTNRAKLYEIMDKTYWIKKIGAFKTNSSKDSHEELGNRYIILFNRMLDESTKNSFRLTEYNKRNIYNIIRWMIQNYRELWNKDNLDMLNKKLRCYDYVASFLNQTVSDRIKKLVNTSVNTRDKVVNEYNKFFAYRGNEVISKLHSSGLMRYDDTVNDMDFFQKFKVTQKGPNSAGQRNNSKTISANRRALHPSQLGREDINVCSASDPGLTNYITPTCETEGLYFKGAPPEPETFNYEFKKELGEYDEEGYPVVIIDPVKYNMILDTLSDCHIQGVDTSDGSN